ncbi:MAG: HAMP domain-containing protein [Chloroflexi bacterium]|nr:HAMP domain-containing protein [Chloroflexota bacterium]
MRSLRTRLLLAYVGLILAGFTAVAVLAGRQISAGTVQDFSSRLQEQTQLVARAFADPLEEDYDKESDWTEIRSLLQTYAQQTNTTIVLTDDHGDFWLSSSGERSSTNTPEIRSAQSGAVSSEIRGSVVYAAAPIWEDDDVIAVVQLAAPLSGAAALVWQRWLGLATAVLGVTAVAAIAAFWLATTLTRPLEQLRHAALQIAQGNFRARLPETRQDEIGQVAHAFNHMSGQVEAMIEAQRAFASNASHELRTPLTTIRLRSEALRDGALDDTTAQRYIVEIDEEVRRLGNLVQDLMLLSRLDAGRQEIGHEQVDPIRLARQLLHEIAPAAASRHINLTLDAPETAPPLTASFTHLTIVFRNLLNNALNYTPDGGQVIWRLEPVGPVIRHTIQDNGMGIAAEDLPHLFDRFYRADKSRSRAAPGVGLGLSLVKLIVELYGGQIGIVSAGLGEGTAVTVQWPLGEATIPG